MCGRLEEIERNKYKESFKKTYGRDPTDEELLAFIEYAFSIASIPRTCTGV